MFATFVRTILPSALAGAGSFILVFVSCAAVLDVSFELATLGATVAGLATFGAGVAGEFED